MSERTESIRKKFLRRLHRVMFQSIPNDANEVDLSKLKRKLEPEESLEITFEWPQDSRNPNLKQS